MRLWICAIAVSLAKAANYVPSETASESNAAVTEAASAEYVYNMPMLLKYMGPYAEASRLRYELWRVRENALMQAFFMVEQLWGLATFLFQDAIASTVDTVDIISAAVELFFETLPKATHPMARMYVQRLACRTRLFKKHLPDVFVCPGGPDEAMSVWDGEDELRRIQFLATLSPEGEVNLMSGIGTFVAQLHIIDMAFAENDREEWQDGGALDKAFDDAVIFLGAGRHRASMSMDTVEVAVAVAAFHVFVAIQEQGEGPMAQTCKLAIFMDIDLYRQVSKLVLGILMASAPHVLTDLKMNPFVQCSTMPFPVRKFFARAVDHPYSQGGSLTRDEWLATVYSMPDERTPDRWPSMQQHIRERLWLTVRADRKAMLWLLQLSQRGTIMTFMERLEQSLKLHRVREANRFALQNNATSLPDSIKSFLRADITLDEWRRHARLVRQLMWMYWENNREREHIFMPLATGWAVERLRFALLAKAGARLFAAADLSPAAIEMVRTGRQNALMGAWWKEGMRRQMVETLSLLRYAYPESRLLKMLILSLREVHLEYKVTVPPGLAALCDPLLPELRALKADALWASVVSN